MGWVFWPRHAGFPSSGSPPHQKGPKLTHLYRSGWTVEWVYNFLLPSFFSLLYTSIHRFCLRKKCKGKLLRKNLPKLGRFSGRTPWVVFRRIFWRVISFSRIGQGRDTRAWWTNLSVSLTFEGIEKDLMHIILRWRLPSLSRVFVRQYTQKNVL